MSEKDGTKPTIRDRGSPHFLELPRPAHSELAQLSIQDRGEGPFFPVSMDCHTKRDKFITHICFEGVTLLSAQTDKHFPGTKTQLWLTYRSVESSLGRLNLMPGAHTWRVHNTAFQKPSKKKHVSSANRSHQQALVVGFFAFAFLRRQRLKYEALSG